MVPAQCRQQRTVSPLSRVNAALACELGRLPEVLRDGDLLHARTFLQKCISRVDVMTNRHGAGTATRCVVARSISPVYLPPEKVNLPWNKSGGPKYQYRADQYWCGIGADAANATFNKTFTVFVTRLACPTWIINPTQD